jgi:glycosyltransferase involved in cell wall biosynthesis
MPLETNYILSVIICTYNNAESLDISLGQLNQQKYNHRLRVEYLVVDNNSSDHTASVIQKHMINNPLIVSVFEPKQGLSHARNTGVNLAKGQYVLFTDDDAELPDNWINEYLNIINSWQPDCCFSKIAVVWNKQKPWWYCNVYRSCFVELNYGDKLIQVKDLHHEFYGKNFCLKKSELHKIGGFDPKLGRMGDRLIAGEETIIYRRFVSNRKNIIYFPNAAVGHRLKDREYTLEHITKLFIDNAYSTLHMANIFSTKKVFNRPLGIFFRAVKEIITSMYLYVLYLLNKNQQLSFYQQLKIKRSLRILLLWFKS